MSRKRKKPRGKPTARKKRQSSLNKSEKGLASPRAEAKVKSDVSPDGKQKRKVSFGRLKVLTALGQIASAFLPGKANAY